ncbi:hypothetical protein [Denitromonas ohlonensis]|uniref:Uncharacterized protein n=2 Tax=Denitromonas TaxID=139331 RepID=A0A557S3I0_9RHOO|nr:hypothetical protein [Denitromonas ohlonensis]TVO67350.1 hypothetical protein FHP90_06975 [Denitromonas ohlonensis]TVO71969.1 hypothetical protein FHP89_19110 [Denitromonas ohlonensis]
MAVVQDESLDEGATEDAIEDIARLRKVILYLQGIYENIDPEVTPFSHLPTIQNSAQNLINEINAYIGNKNPGHLTNANNHADSLLLQFQQTPASIYAASAESIKDTVTAYSETIGTYISKYRVETEQSVADLASRIKNLNDVINEFETKLIELRSQIGTVEQTIQKQTTEFNTQYQASEKTRSDKFDKELDDYSKQSENNIEKYSHKADEEFKNLFTKSGKIIEVLTKLQDDASKVYGVTINTLQAGAYSSYANDEGKVANKYRSYASILMLIGVSFLVFPELRLIIGNGDYTFDWLKVVGRIPLSLVVFVPAFYFAKESGKHRTNETSNRRRQHILTTLDPYIELMDPENAETLRVHVAKTVFSESLPSSEHKDNETGNILSQLANLAKQIKGN